jgi:hypothetical protein
MMSDRWNYEMHGEHLYVCRNLHEKGDKCDYEPVTVDDIERYRERIALLEKAATDVVESEFDSRRQQATHWHNPTIDILARVLESGQ